MSDVANTAAQVAGPDLSVILIDISVLTMMAITAIAIARLRSLFALVMLSGVYSLLSATWFVIADAVDVAFTEAAVGAGISSALILGAMLLTVRVAKEDKPLKRIAPMLVVVITGAILFYATIDLPGFGDPNSPANSYLAQEFLQRNYGDIGIPNVVTSVLASYRGFDTFGETGVVFIAGVAVALLLGFGERSLSASLKKKKGDEK
jgi:multicomponent Na+:H+ antiporter subunit B